jgi:hypothetical protein
MTAKTARLNAVVLDATPAEIDYERTRRRWFVWGLVLLIGSTGSAGVRLMPASFDNPPGVSHAGLLYFRSAISPTELTSLAVPTFVWAFRFLLAAAWIGYATMLLAGFRQNHDLGPYTVPAVGIAAMSVALLFSTLLSSDIYAYAGWGRMDGPPRLESLRALRSPVWRSSGISRTHRSGRGIIDARPSGLRSCRRGGVFRHWSVVPDPGAQNPRRRGSRRGGDQRGRSPASHDSRRANLTALAIGLNPLFLIEGPGNGQRVVARSR